MTRQDELEHRVQLWQRLQSEDLGALEPTLLRELGVYGGAQGIWVDKRRTGPLTPEGTE